VKIVRFADPVSTKKGSGQVIVEAANQTNSQTLYLLSNNRVEVFLFDPRRARERSDGAIGDELLPKLQYTAKHNLGYGKYVSVV
jgi:hypothetical protein